jgi:hypothetical protein
MVGTRQDAQTVVWLLAGELQQRHGMTRVYGRGTRSLGVLSVATGLTVWTDGAIMRWSEAGTVITWPATDIPGAAVTLAALATGPTWNG